MRKVFIILFFIIQIGLIFYNLNKDVKFFNWAMYHTDIVYTATATINGIELNDQDFQKRYKIPRKGIESRALGILKRKLTQREIIYKDSNQVVLSLSYSENTHKGKWTWRN